ncbi:unnamed protein product [Allacma fusca]|uniref:Uncharacterized protein n=1 Tax=Allacma fusca TaxID=39272 RepID=A0A8J2JQE9_9HEXA|nr:unnamed protein product [Allacma fusca]
MDNTVVLWREKLTIISKLIIELCCSFLYLKTLDAIVGISIILILPTIFSYNYSVGFLIYICCWKYAMKFYHGGMALLVFCWLLGSMTISLRTCSSSNWVDFQYLKKLHHCVFEKLSHHLLQLSARNTDKSAG